MKKTKLFFLILVSLFPFGLTYHFWTITSHNIEKIRYAKFESLAKESEVALINRLNSYQNVLFGGKGFFEGSSAVDRSEWKAYVSAIDILNNYPGINGMGVIYDVSDSELPTFVAASQKDGCPDFHIHPPDEKSFSDAHFVITYIEPFEINKEALGLNIAFEKNRFDAAVRARDTGQATITKRILLVQDQSKTPGFLLLLPVYEPGMPLRNVSERRNAFKFWIYAPFIGLNFMDSLTSSQGNSLHLQIYDGHQSDSNHLIYDSSNLSDIHNSKTLTLSKDIEIMGQNWRLTWTSTLRFDELVGSNESLYVFILGLLFSCGFVVFLFSVFSNTQEMVIDDMATSYFIPVIVSLVCFLCTFYFYREIHNSEQRYVRFLTQRAADNLRFSLDSAINSHIAALNRMADRWALRDGLGKPEWLSDSRSYLKNHSGLKAVEWVDSNFHVKWIEPLKGNESVLGLDLLAEANRREFVLKASTLNSPSLSNLFYLKQGYLGFITHSPIHRNGEFLGFIQGVFSIPELLDSAMGAHGSSHFLVSLSDNKGHVYSNYDSDSSFSSEFSQVMPLTIYNQNMTLTVSPSSGSPFNLFTLPVLFLVMGTLLSLMAGVLVFFSQRNERRNRLLSEQKNLLSIFVKRVPAAVAMFDSDMRYILASDRWCSDYGLEKTKIIGRSLYDVFPRLKTDYPEWVQLYGRCLLGEYIEEDEALFKRLNGPEIWLHYVLHPLKDERGHVYGLIAFTENITERKEMDRLKDDFISTVNHELRTPLTSIQGALGLLKIKATSQIDDKSQHLLHVAYDNCQQLGTLVNDILDMEKISSGKLKFVPAATDLVPLLVDVVEKNHTYAEQFAVKFVFKTKLQTAVCFVDAQRYTQVITNLLSNAAKFSHENDVVEVNLSHYNAGYYRVEVKDHGIGIPREFHAKIFERFLQVDGSSTRNKGGTGLGLSISKSIVEKMGGKISFESKEGKGTSFFVDFPILEGTVNE